ncbi:unnamed protein product [Rotaria magnacalcarata]|uniref:Uncharacterized protein n=3 Tax=Rotaria magnacalcarata TaxID=392030 RepID=A0A814SBD1_9BILA|nr:unnamed protein product [Rotaria magnacalcarata]CAF1614514.1 unnamed protein product [Rotaria magnacalcarata]CAF2097186.1 unnamed protein product [Rotaria magnacalcarata]CAF3759126.1 unnamed protein product [Rotaria magnacalcarata]CAF3787380.1 unnamed protein product [Rotaria magnacalcarata]
MASYNLVILCDHRTYELFVNPNLSKSEIVERIGSHFDLSQNSFHVQIYDERFLDYIDFDEEYAEELQQRLPRTHTTTLNARVTCWYRNDSEKLSDQSDDILLGANKSDIGIFGIYPSENSPSIDRNAEIDLCLSDNSLRSNIIETPLFETSIPLSRVIFTRDVAPYQRQYYQSDFWYEGKKIRTKKNYYISRLQAVKGCFDAEYTSVLPEIKIPLNYLRYNQLKLFVAIVTEERKEDKVTWRLHPRKGFLPAGAETNTPHMNPIHVNIQKSELKEDGIFRLKLRMVQICQKHRAEDGAIFHVLPLCTIQDLHPAHHVPNTPRLICVMANENEDIQWATLGLSDFIRPIVSHKRKLKTD